MTTPINNAADIETMGLIHRFQYVLARVGSPVTTVPSLPHGSQVKTPVH